MFVVRTPPISDTSMRAMSTEIRRELCAGGAVSDDTRLSLRHIEAEIKRETKVVIRLDDDANWVRGILPDNKRHRPLGCIPLRDTTDFDCNCIKQGGSFKKAVLPELYSFRGTRYISYLGSTDLSTPFTKFSDIFGMNAKSSYLDVPSYFLVDNAAYVYLPTQYSLLCDITVIGIPEDPAHTDGNCFDVFNAKWPVEERLKSLIKERVMQRYGRNVLGTANQQDIRNNGQDGNIRAAVVKD